MPYRQTVLAAGEIYHVFNRGVASLPLFHSSTDYSRFIQLIDYYQFANTPTSFSSLMKLPIEEREPILDNLRKENNLQAEILVFCLMPNHYHFLLKQIAGKGLTSFMGNIQNSYAKYLNIKEHRAGPLYQSPFKAKRIETDEQLLHVSRYIHLNPSTGFVVEIEKLTEYPWSSLPTYLGNTSKSFSFVNPKLVINFFKNPDQYKEFVFNQAEYQRELARIKHLVIE